jgi:peptidoglycan pentaglycine glycine transferase (the first glycine)
MSTPSSFVKGSPRSSFSVRGHNAVPSSSHAVGPYSVRVSDAPDDPEWDDFLEQVPMGHHAQTSCWGRARASIDWQPVRLVVSENGQIVAGVQMVTRPMPIGGNVGFVHRGPVVPEGHHRLAGVVLDEMMAMGKMCNVQYLVVQPPRGGHWMREELVARGLRYGAFDIDHTSTVLIEMNSDIDGLLATMKKNTRKHIKEAERSDLTVRRGSEADLPIFTQLKAVHSARLGYAPRESGYYQELWRALAPRRHIELFIAEYHGEPVSAQLAIPFGDTCRHMERMWSGEHGQTRPNERVKWETIKWAKSEGYRFTDLEGIEPALAEMVLSGEPVPDDSMYSASRFKLKFAPPGEVVIDPPSFDYVYNPLLRFAYRCIPNRLMRSARMRKLLFMFRETGS